jgi:hypothetical protein
VDRQDSAEAQTQRFVHQTPVLHYERKQQMKLPKLKDWGLRLLALVLAIIIYHSLKDESNSSKDKNDRSFFEYR